MHGEKLDVVIIGAGLTGLTLAYLLGKTNLSIRVVESRSRLGGRIHTLVGDKHPPLEMGATWLGSKHQNLSALLDELGIHVFEQKIGSTAIYEAISTSPPVLAQLPPNPEPSLRIAGGSVSLVNRLHDEVGSEFIVLGKTVTEIAEMKEGLKVMLHDGGQLYAGMVVSTLPPYLFSRCIMCSPALQEEFYEVASQTHTWMGESIKVSLTYEEPFWRNPGLSGTIFSNVGPISEMYDHSNIEDNKYALKGFLSGTYWSVSQSERLEIVLKQLRKYYGMAVDDFTKYEDCAWKKEENTFLAYTRDVLPHQNNGHDLYGKSYMHDRLFIAGSETSKVFPGYMEGAVASARETADKIVK